MSARDGHLGDLAAALVDSALDGDLRDQALAHITGCEQCRAEVDQQRALKDLLRRSIEPAPPEGLADRLRAIGPGAGARRLPRWSQPTPAPQPVPKPRTPATAARRRPTGAARPSPAPDRVRGRRMRQVTSGVTVLAFGVAAAVTFGAARGQDPAISPPVGRYTVEHARTTGGVPGADPGAGAVMTVSVNR